MTRRESGPDVTIHTHACGEGGIFVNAYQKREPSAAAGLAGDLVRHRHGLDPQPKTLVPWPPPTAVAYNGFIVLSKGARTGRARGRHDDRRVQAHPRARCRRPSPAPGGDRETVKVQVKHVMEELGASDRTQAVAIGIRRGIIQL